MEKKFMCPNYLTTLTEGFCAIKDEFCDARLVVGDKIFRSHKFILAAYSKYFRSIFVQNFNERQSEEIRIPPEIDAEAMQTLLNFFYSGELILSQENTDSVFRATDYMRLDSLLEICIEYMQETLNPANCIRRYVMAETIEYSSEGFDCFKEAASALIVDEAVKDFASAEILSLSPTLISKIVKFNKKPEKAEAVCTTILKWVAHDEENRREFLCNLLQMLPVEGISNDFCNTRLRKEPLLLQDNKSLRWLLNSFMLCAANPVSSHQNDGNSLFILNGVHTRKCFRLNLKNSTPLAMCDFPEISNFSVVCHNKQIYLFSGLRPFSYRLDNPETSWVKCDLDFNFRRSDAGCAVLGDDLFVIGGRCPRTLLNLSTCTKFNFGVGRREDLPSMSVSRCVPGAVVHANSIYAACGDGASSSIERFDSREGRWCVVGKYETEIEFCSSATVGDNLYSCDFKDGIVARFDLRAGRSQEICGLPSTTHLKRYWMTSVDGNLYGAFGGSILKYDEVINIWTDVCSVGDMTLPIIVPWN